MDESRRPSGGTPLSLHGPDRRHLRGADRAGSSQALPADFVPLRLVLEAGGLMVEFTQPDMLVGRHSEADVRLPLPDVSRRHCRFVFEDGEWRVIDLQSLNGVYVNGEQIQEAALHHGDTVRIGGFHFIAQLKARNGEEAAAGEALARQAGVIQHIANALPPPQRKAS